MEGANRCVVILSYRAGAALAIRRHESSSYYNSKDQLLTLGEYGQSVPGCHPILPPVIP